jgi:hypothetical protein
MKHVNDAIWALWSLRSSNPGRPRRVRTRAHGASLLLCARRIARMAIQDIARQGITATSAWPGPIPDHAIGSWRQNAADRGGHIWLVARQLASDLARAAQDQHTLDPVPPAEAWLFAIANRAAALWIAANGVDDPEAWIVDSLFDVPDPAPNDLNEDKTIDYFGESEKGLLE